MDIRLNSLSEKFFKGIKKFELRLNGKSANIYGDNGTGKTTQNDAFRWLLFGKDSFDRSIFKIKPQDSSGNDIHNLQIEVEAELLIDGKLLLLKKMQEEKWTKKRGSADAELTGNTISYWWDEVPVKESEYKQKINELIDENVFKLITDPQYFSLYYKVGKLTDWQSRRQLLLEMCGDMSDEEVISSDDKLSKLAEILNGRSIEDYKKILNEKIKLLEKERDDKQPRIDELTLTMPQAQGDYSAIEAKLQEYKNILSGIEIDLTNASSVAGEFRKKQQELYGLKGKLENIKTRINSEAGSGRKKLVDEKSQLETEKYRLEADIIGYKGRVDQNNKLIDSNNSELVRLRNEWKEINSRQFVEPDEDNFICPTCGHALPEDAKELKIADMNAKFEANKKTAIENNVSRGKSLNDTVKQLQNSNDELNNKISNAEKRVAAIDSRLNELNIQISQPAVTPDYSSDPEYTELAKQITELQAELEKPVEDTTSSIIQRKNEIQAKIDGCNKILNDKETAEKTQKRIDQLKDEEKKLSDQISQLEGHKFLMEKFTVQKVNLLEDKINSHFKFVTFKMFNRQVNGGIDECCDPMINGVPFSDANHASRVNAGLDIINALSAYYGVTAPIFVDGRESVVKILDMPSQIISLVVCEKDKTLRVEVDD